MKTFPYHSFSKKFSGFSTFSRPKKSIVHFFLLSRVKTHKPSAFTTPRTLCTVNEVKKNTEIVVRMGTFFSFNWVASMFVLVRERHFRSRFRLLNLWLQSLKSMERCSLRWQHQKAYLFIMTTFFDLSFSERQKKNDPRLELKCNT